MAKTNKPPRVVWVVEVNGAPVDAYTDRSSAIDSSYSYCPSGEVVAYRRAPQRKKRKAKG